MIVLYENLRQVRVFCLHRAQTLYLLKTVLDNHYNLNARELLHSQIRKIIHR